MARRTINLPAKTAGQLIQDADDVLRVTEDRRGVLIDGLIASRGELLPDGTPVPYGAAIDIHTGAIKDGRGRLATADYAHRDPDGALEALRIDRRTYLTEAGQAVLNTRVAFGSFFEDRIAFLAGFPRILPTSVRAMIDHGRHLSDRLHNPEPEVAALFAEHDVDASTFYEMLDPAVEKLAGANERFRQGQNALEEAVIARSSAMENLRDVLVPAAQGISSLFRLAGLDELATRVRRSARRARNAAAAEQPAGGNTEGEDSGEANEAQEPSQAATAEPGPEVVAGESLEPGGPEAALPASPSHSEPGADVA